MTSLNEKLVRIIGDYDPMRQDMLCKIDIIRLSQMDALRNPTPDKKDVIEAFLKYATAVVNNHPDKHLNENIEKMFGDSLEKMAEIAPQAYEKYQQANMLHMVAAGMQKTQYVHGM
ncbi:MAG: hypothetical protein J5896_03445 [Alphaproteobacteria bacterium]|nr:hypothetical protein [Alphaproteobacteria bacterium]